MSRWRTGRATPPAEPSALSASFLPGAGAPSPRNFATALRSLAPLLALALLAATSFSGCAKRDPAPTPENTLRLSQRNEPATLDPHLATLPDEYFILRALSEGLTVPDPAGGPPLPGAAQSWTVSEDGKRFTFRLRADARWSNGDPVTAGDFVFSIRRALTPALASPRAELFFVLRNAVEFHRGDFSDFSAVGVAAPDEHTLVLETSEPAPYLPTLVASGPWLPLHRASVEAAGGTTRRDAAWTRPGNLVGNGPFRLTEWRPGQHLQAVRNSHYHSLDRVRVEGLRFQIYDSGDTEERAFRAGQVDVTLSVPAAKLETYTERVLRRDELHETRFFALNTTRPPLNDTRVRQALSLAIDRTALVQRVLRGGQQPALSFIPPGLGGYVGPAQLYHDPEAARRLLTEAGFPGGSGLPRLELSTWGVSPALLEAVQQMWRRELGVETSIVQREGKVHMAAVLSGDFSIALLPAIPDYGDPSALFGDWTSGAVANHARWSDLRFDELTHAAAREIDPTRRHELYRTAERLLLNAMPVVPLYFNRQNYLVAPRVKGWRQDALWNRFYLDVSLSDEKLPLSTDRHRAQP
jgi:oligopeptide transport system substrate-binding protein